MGACRRVLYSLSCTLLLLGTRPLFTLPAAGCPARLERELSLTDYVKIEVSLCCPTAAVRCLGYDAKDVDVLVYRCARRRNIRMALLSGVARLGSGQSNIRLAGRRRCSTRSGRLVRPAEGSAPPAPRRVHTDL